jgi:hypothetical protein
MNPLSVASGIAGLLSLADVVISRSWTTIIACKNASPDSRRLLQEVQSLMGILRNVEILEQRRNDTGLQTSIPAEEIAKCQKTLQDMRDKLLASDPKEPGLPLVRRAKRTLKWPFTAKGTDEFIQRPERHKSSFNLALTAEAIEAVLRGSQATRTGVAAVQRVSRNLDTVLRVVVNEERRKLLESVGAYDADGKWHMNMSLCHPGPGLWFARGPEYISWSTKPGSKLWVHGIPGAGKTVLSALSVRSAFGMASDDSAILFYYFEHKDDKARRLENMRSTLVGQMARQSEKCMLLMEGGAYANANPLAVVTDYVAAEDMDDTMDNTEDDATDDAGDDAADDAGDQALDDTTKADMDDDGRCDAEDGADGDAVDDACDESDGDAIPGNLQPSDAEKLLGPMIDCFSKVAVIVDGLDEAYDPGECAEWLSEMSSRFPRLQILLFSRKESSIEPFVADYR